MILQAIILGIVQGLTEFLPISSSAHLYLLPHFLNWNYQGLGFDVALHAGTLLAILVIFWRDYTDAIFGSRRLLKFLIIGSIPGALAGYFLKSQAETIFRTPLLTAVTLAAFALLLWWADRFHSRSSLSIQQINHLKNEEFKKIKINWKKSLLIGCAQALAIIPGVSRSGATMTAGLFLGFTRQEAARLSFLLSGPIIFGAALATSAGTNFDLPLLAGFIAAAVSSFAAIKFLLKYLATHNFNIFVWYRLALAGIILLTFLNN